MERRIPSNLPRAVRLWLLMAQPGVITQKVVGQIYAGFGAADDPYVVQRLPKVSAIRFNQAHMKWFIILIAALGTLVVALFPRYTGGIVKIEAQFQVLTEVATLGVSLYGL